MNETARDERTPLREDPAVAPFQASSLVDIVRARARVQETEVAYRFLVEGDEDELSLTYAELDAKARTIAAWLQERRTEGERALLLYPPGLDFIVGFLGCLYAGVIAVPAYPPRPRRPDPRIQEILADAGAVVALHHAYADLLRDRATSYEGQGPFELALVRHRLAGLGSHGRVARDSR